MAFNTGIIYTKIVTYNYQTCAHTLGVELMKAMAFAMQRPCKS